MNLQRVSGAAVEPVQGWTLVVAQYWMRRRCAPASEGE